MPLKKALNNTSTKERIYILISAAVILSLVAVNIYLFMGQPNEHKACYKDLCLYSNIGNPVNQMEELIETSKESKFVFGGEENKTSENSLTFQAAIDMIESLGSKTNLSDEHIYVISYQKGTPVKCENLVNQSFSVEQCQTITPEEDEVFLHLEYPSNTENRVDIEGRKVIVKTKTPKDLLGTAIFLKEKFF